MASINAQNTATPGTGLTEDDIKRKFVPFLRDFYRNRYEPMPNTVEVELDNVSDEGYVADGKITFRKSDGSPFVCTYEATSRDKVDEVKFARNVLYFLWDCVAFAALGTAVLYGFFYATRLRWLIDLGWTGNFGLLIGLYMIVFFAWYFTMHNWKKYRFIHAVEQFKRYQVDEQWIALAEDVFPAPTDPYLIELRNQCIYHGFGLAIVPAEGLVRKLRDPSRLAIFGKDRKIAHFVTRTQWYQAMSQNVSQGVARYRAPDTLQVWWNKIIRPIDYQVIDPIRRGFWRLFSRPLGETASAYTRFMEGQNVQKWMCLLAIVVLSPLVWRVLSFRDVEIADLDKLQRWEGGKNPEEEAGYRPDDRRGIVSGISKQFPEPIEADVTTIDLSSGTEDETPTITLSGGDDETTPAASTRKVRPVKPLAKRIPKVDICAQVKGKRGWLIQDNVFSTKAGADTRLATLQKKKIAASIIWRGCLESGTEGYVIWLGDLQMDEKVARKQAATLQKTLQNAKVADGKVIVRKVGE